MTLISMKVPAAAAAATSEAGGAGSASGVKATPSCRAMPAYSAANTAEAKGKDRTGDEAREKLG